MGPLVLWEALMWENEYLGRNPKMGYWRDTHLKIQGSSAHELQLRFLLDWRASSSEI